MDRTVILLADGFLPQFGQDLIAVFGLLGVLGTAIGIWMSYEQTKRTADASQASAQAIENSRRDFEKYIISQSFHLLTEVRGHVDKADFRLASTRLGDLADLLTQVNDSAQIWADRIDRLHKMEQAFRKLNREAKTLSDSQRGKWHRLDSEIRLAIGGLVGPFAQLNEVTPDDT